VAADALHGPEDRAAPWRLYRSADALHGPRGSAAAPWWSPPRPGGLHRAPMPSTAPEARLPPPGAAGAAPPRPRLGCRFLVPPPRPRLGCRALVPPPRPSFGCRALVVFTVPLVLVRSTGPELRLPCPGGLYRSTGPEVCAAPWCRCRCAGAAAALLALHRPRGAAAPAAGDSTAPKFRAVAAAPLAREWCRVLAPPRDWAGVPGALHPRPRFAPWLPLCPRCAPRLGSLRCA
jgi:hypothetical protein